MGPLVLELYWQHAPRTCKNFAELSRRGYYNGTKFHRIIKDFMVQGGDPTGTGERRPLISPWDSPRCQGILLTPRTPLQAVVVPPSMGNSSRTSCTLT